MSYKNMKKHYYMPNTTNRGGEQNCINELFSIIEQMKESLLDCTKWMAAVMDGFGLEKSCGARKVLNKAVEVSKLLER